MRHMDDHDRDTRDLQILKMLDNGMTQQQVAERMEISRGPIARLIGDIRRDEKIVRAGQKKPARRG